MKRSFDRLFDLNGRIALVTGAGRGLGKEAAIALAGSGARVILNARNVDDLERTAAGIRDLGAAADVLPLNLLREPELGIARSVDIHGRLDIVVHAAVSRDRRATKHLTGEAFRTLIENNLASAYDLARAAIPHLSHSDAGRLIFMSSIGASIARAGDPAYIAAKGGLSALARAFAVEAGDTPFTCNIIAPGLFATESNAALLSEPAFDAFVHTRVPLKRCGDPAEIGSAVIFLASPASSYVNGITLTVDGGLSAQM